MKYWTIAHGSTELGASYMMINGPQTDAVEVVPASALFARMGYFPWGKGAWIHGDDEGTVLSTADVLERITVTDKHDDLEVAPDQDA